MKQIEHHGSLTLKKDAAFSLCRRYRYTLHRIWDEHVPYCQFIGLNPSTADEQLDDPTVRRCIQYARDWGFGGLVMTNLLAYRSTDPHAMIEHYLAGDRTEIIETNFKEILRIARSAGIVVAAWGNHGTLLNASHDLVTRFDRERLPLHALKVTKTGQPNHPLYLSKNLKPERFTSQG